MDLSASTARGLDSQSARAHASSGSSATCPGGLLGRVEAYYKAFDHLIVGRLETPDETAARVAAYDFPRRAGRQRAARAVDHHRCRRTAGSGRAYGFDVYVRRAARAATRLTGWASYTYGVATREAYGRTFPFDYDRRHAATVVGNLRSGARLRCRRPRGSAAGFPRTPVQRPRASAGSGRGRPRPRRQPRGAGARARCAGRLVLRHRSRRRWRT